jgi:hypothetical protein
MKNWDVVYKEADFIDSNHDYEIDVKGTWYWYKRWIDEVKKYCQEEYGENI